MKTSFVATLMLIFSGIVSAQSSQGCQSYQFNLSHDSSSKCKAVAVGKGCFVVHSDCEDQLIGSARMTNSSDSIHIINKSSLIHGRKYIVFRSIRSNQTNDMGYNSLERLSCLSPSLNKVIHKEANTIARKCLDFQKREDNDKYRQREFDLYFSPAPLKTPERIVQEALLYEGRIDDQVFDGRYYRAWDYLRSLIYISTRGKRKVNGKFPNRGTMYPIHNIKNHNQPIWKNQKGETKKYSWCGVWAAHILQNAGFDVYWGIGKMKGKIRTIHRFRREFDINKVEVGDVVVGPGPLWHHGIVIGIRVKDGEVSGFETMNGNHPGISKGFMAAKRVVANIKPIK